MQYNNYFYLIRVFDISKEPKSVVIVFQAFICIVNM